MDQADDVEDHAPMSTQEHPTGLRILVVDDNAALVQTLATLLNLSGHVVETALSGTDALARIATFSPDVVLLDVGLPGMDGFSVAREIRARHQGGPLRIIAISGYGHAEYQTMGKEAGFDAYLVKPIDHEELDRLLALYMQQADPTG
jgi:CheY-like chemotaxis protein